MMGRRKVNQLKLRIKHAHPDDDGMLIEPRPAVVVGEWPRLICAHCGSIFRIESPEHIVCNDCVEKAMKEHGFVRTRKAD